jgi:hypothetical protein
MVDTDAAATRLRAFVRERVKPGGRFYEHGAGARLVAHLQAQGFAEDAAWLSVYTDLDAKPRRHADLDVALEICRFFGVELEAFRRGKPEPDTTPTQRLAQAEAQSLGERVLALPPDRKAALLLNLEALERLPRGTRERGGASPPADRGENRRRKP